MISSVFQNVIYFFLLSQSLLKIPSSYVGGILIRGGTNQLKKIKLFDTPLLHFYFYKTAALLGRLHCFCLIFY